jgi:hypothetical protein
MLIVHIKHEMTQGILYIYVHKKMIINTTVKIEIVN